MSRTRTSLALTLVIAVLLALAGSQAAGEAATASRLALLSIEEDSFRNYDFLSRSVSASNVDWPINLLFWNNAEVDKVKNGLPYAYVGSTMYARLNDGTGYVWDADGGRKSSPCPILGQATHYRLYADGDDRLYNLTWGYYALASSHFDTRECGPGKWFGRSEDAEAKIAAAARARWGASRVAEDSISFENAEPYREEGNHIWLNDGLGTTVSVP
jgi:hypothetical protein